MQSTLFVPHDTWRSLQGQYNLLLEPLTLRAHVLESCLWNQWRPFLINYRSLSSCCNNQVTIQVLNVSPSSVTLYKGMSLGKVTPGDDVLLVCEESTETHAPGLSFDDLHLPNLSETEKSTLLGLLAEFSDVFAPVIGPRGCTTAVKHAIPTTGPPIRQPVHRLPAALKNTVRTEVQYMLENDYHQT